MKKIKPPLPFVGHKGHWASELTEIALKLPKNCTVIDVFGGSGICSYYIKQARPDLAVVWNDYDNYAERLEHAEDTERLRQRLLDLLGVPVRKGTFIPPLNDEQRAVVLNECKRLEAQTGFVDYQTLSRWFYLYPLKADKMRLFSGKMHNRVPVVPIRVDACRSWLREVYRTCFCFSGLDTAIPGDCFVVHPRDFIRSQDVLFIFDPPYLGTGCNDYGNKDALKILQSIVECCACLPFLLFGDVSISFWYEVLFRGDPVTKYTKDINNIGMNHTKRTEVIFARLPGEGGGRGLV